MSKYVPHYRPSSTHLRDLPAEEQAQQAQRDATEALIKIRRMEERIDALERNLQTLANAVNNLAGHRRSYVE